MKAMETKLFNLIMNLNEVIFETDLNGYFVFLSPSWECLTGYSVQESLGNHLNQYIFSSGHKLVSFLDHTLSLKEKGRFTAKVKTKTKDAKWVQLSISYICNEQEQVTGVCGTLIDVTNIVELEREKEAEIQLAISVQKSALSQPITLDDIKICGEYHPCHDLSGDLYYWRQISQTRFAVFIMDVVGHGMSSALISMSIRSLLRGIFSKVQEPLQVFQELNSHMNSLHITKGGYKTYFSSIYLLIDTREKTIEYVNSGHPPGILLEAGRVIELDKGTVPIGLLESPLIEKGIITYEGPVEIFLYTDGLLELCNKNKLLSIVNGYKPSQDSTLSKYIMHEVNINRNLPDDLCMVSVILK